MTWAQMMDNIGKNLSEAAAGNITKEALRNAGQRAERAASAKGLDKMMYAGIGIGTLGGVVIGSNAADEHPIIGGALGGAAGYGIGSVASAIAIAKKL